MRSWRPITEEQVWEALNAAYDPLGPSERRFFESIRIEPTKWTLHPWGDEGGGFWVVAIIGKHVLWYNDIEHGFNCSEYREFGEIGDYWCNQDSLAEAVRALKSSFEIGRMASSASPPRVG